VIVFLFRRNYSSIKYKIKIASPASACNEMKKVAIPIEMNSKANIAGIATSFFWIKLKTQKATKVMIPPRAK